MIIVNTIFFQKVVQLSITKASPKHPQSVTGFAKAIQKVRGVITHIKSIPTNVDSLGRTPSNMVIPTKNSNADITIEPVNANQSAKEMFIAVA